MNPRISEVRAERVLAVRDSMGRHVRGPGETMPGVFRQAEGPVRGDYEAVQLSFDSTLGYPTELIADRRVDTTDDHFIIYIALRPLEPSRRDTVRRP